MNTETTVRVGSARTSRRPGCGRVAQLLFASRLSAERCGPDAGTGEARLLGPVVGHRNPHVDRAGLPLLPKGGQVRVALTSLSARLEKILCRAIDTAADSVL